MKVGALRGMKKLKQQKQNKNPWQEREKGYVCVCVHCNRLFLVTILT